MHHESGLQSPETSSAKLRKKVIVTPLPGEPAAGFYSAVSTSLHSRIKEMAKMRRMTVSATVRMIL